MSEPTAQVPAGGQLRINGFFLIRAIVEPIRGAPPSRSWEMEVDLLSPDSPQPRYYLFGTLTACQDSRLVRVVVGSGLDLPGGSDPGALDPKDLRARCLRLFEETLWDATASFARPLAAMAAIRELEIPMKCPTPPSVWTD